MAIRRLFDQVLKDDCGSMELLSGDKFSLCPGKDSGPLSEHKVVLAAHRGLNGAAVHCQCRALCTDGDLVGFRSLSNDEVKYVF